MKPYIPEESPVETAPVRIARRQVATYIRGRDNDAPQQNGFRGSQTRTLDQDSSGFVLDVACDEEVEPIAAYDGMEKGQPERVGRDFQQGTQTFHARLAGDQSIAQVQYVKS